MPLLRRLTALLAKTAILSFAISTTRRRSIRKLVHLSQPSPWRTAVHLAKAGTGRDPQLGRPLIAASS